MATNSGQTITDTDGHNSTTTNPKNNTWQPSSSELRLSQLPHHRQCESLHLLFKDNVPNIAQALESLFPNNSLASWDPAGSSGIWLDDGCSCDVSSQLPNDEGGISD